MYTFYYSWATCQYVPIVHHWCRYLDFFNVVNLTYKIPAELFLTNLTCHDYASVSDLNYVRATFSDCNKYVDIDYIGMGRR